MFWFVLRREDDLGKELPHHPAASAGPRWSVAALTFLSSFTYLYSGVRLRDPGAFSDPLSLIDAVYFATTTVTTTGSGDLLPISEAARLPRRYKSLGVLLSSAWGSPWSYLASLAVPRPPLTGQEKQFSSNGCPKGRYFGKYKWREMESTGEVKFSMPGRTADTLEVHHSQVSLSSGSSSQHHAFAHRFKPLTKCVERRYPRVGVRGSIEMDKRR